jgi:hypothetical protein
MTTTTNRPKQTPTFFKGVILGAAVAMVTLVASAAFAGTGVGKIFNLGEDNRVNSRSQLEGTAPSALFSVTNANKSASASGISIAVPAGNPPLVVNSATKVRNLNADLLDGRDASTFQGAVSQACPNGTAINSIVPTGASTCTTSAVFPIDVHEPPDAGTSDTNVYAPSSLNLAFNCSDPITAVDFADLGQDPATISLDYSEAGGAPDISNQDVSANAGVGIAAISPSKELAGQVIYVDHTSVVTVNIHAIDEGMDGCEFHGTVEVALRSA